MTYSYVVVLDEEEGDYRRIVATLRMIRGVKEVLRACPQCGRKMKQTPSGRVSNLKWCTACHQHNWRANNHEYAKKRDAKRIKARRKKIKQKKDDTEITWASEEEENTEE
jgi:uncharacterized protein with PIN domain